MRERIKLALRAGSRILGGLLLIAAMAPARQAHALPSGRNWTAVDTLHYGIHFIGGPRLETQSNGKLRLLGAGVTDPQSVLLYQWDRTGWRVESQLNLGTGPLLPVHAPAGEEYLVFTGIDPVGVFGTEVYFCFTQTLPTTWDVVDTLAIIRAGAWNYAGAVSATRRWVLVADFGRLRLFTSSKSDHQWTERALEGNGIDGVSIAPLDDTTAVAVWCSAPQITLAIITPDSVKTFTGMPDPKQPPPAAPSLRRRPAGDYWVAWGSSWTWISLTSVDVSGWAPAISIGCAYRDGDQYLGDNPDLSRDTAPRPVVAWSAASTRNGREVICVSCPTDSGYPIAEEIPDAQGGFLASPARDDYGDVWLAWWKYYDGAFWIHSYTAVEVANVLVEGSPFLRTVRWQLTGPAPESWWSVERAEADTNFVVVARVKAGESTSVEWTDSSAVERVYRYRIRRDCLDERYVVWSPSVESRPDQLVTLPIRLSVASSNPSRGGSRLRLSGAIPGSVTISLFDVRGRRVSQVGATAGRGGDAEVGVAAGPSLDGTPIRPGLYFARATDSRGRTSEAIKLAFL